MEREIEILIVGAWAEEIVTEIQNSRKVVKDLDPNMLVYVEAEECNDDENKGVYWNAIADQLDSRQKDSEEIVCGKEIVRNIRERMMRGLIDFIEKKDGRAGKIKRFYKRDERYKNYKKSGNEERWVKKILANELVKTEGDLAVNLVLYFTWLKMDAQIKNGGNYTLKEFVRYAYKTEKGSIEEKNQINKANYNANNVLFPKITGLLKDEMRAAGQPVNIQQKECSYDDDLLEFFYITLAIEFEERIPGKLEKPEILDDLKHEKSENATSRYFI